MINLRTGAGIAAIDSHLYVIGGYDDDNPLSSCEKYDIINNMWTPLPELSYARGGVGVTVMGKQIIVVGGHGIINPYRI